MTNCVCGEIEERERWGGMVVVGEGVGKEACREADGKGRQRRNGVGGWRGEGCKV